MSILIDSQGRHPSIGELVLFTEYNTLTRDGLCRNSSAGKSWKRTSWINSQDFIRLSAVEPCRRLKANGLSSDPNDQKTVASITTESHVMYLSVVARMCRSLRESFSHGKYPPKGEIS